jgi:hypothetical protein
MKNYRTPRTQAEAEFTTGYPIIEPEPPVEWSGWITLGLFVVFLILIFLEVI